MQRITQNEAIYENSVYSRLQRLARALLPPPRLARVAERNLAQARHSGLDY